jgi:hypothetical protein
LVKIGHGGTLDPLARGIVGKKTKKYIYIYISFVVLGGIDCKGRGKKRVL